MNLYGKIATAILALASICYITSVHSLEWDIGWQFYFLSYLLMGYKIRRWSAGRKNNATAALLIIAGCAVNVLLCFINFRRGLQGLPVDVSFYKQNPFSYGSIAPIEVIASCLIFAGFSVLKINGDCSKLAGYTFLIYLIHGGLWDVLSRIIGDRFIGNQIIETISAIVLSVIVFGLSFFAAKIYKRLQLENHLLVRLQKMISKGGHDT